MAYGPTGPMTTYRCAKCGGEFTSDWSDEEAHAEELAVFGEPHKPDDPVICDVCYKWMIEHRPPVLVPAIELNTMSDPTPHYRDETQRMWCGKCHHRFLFDDRMQKHSEAITQKHMELCEGDAAVTLVKIDQAFKDGWRPALPASTGEPG